MKISVWTLQISHRHGENIRVMPSQDAAIAALAAYCEEWWDEVRGHPPMPASAQERIEVYFAGVDDELSHIEPHELDVQSPLDAMIHEALGYEAEAFNHDQPVDGADLVEWFAEWRAQAQVATRIKPELAAGPSRSDRTKRLKSRRREHCVTPAQLSEAIDALGEAAETRRNDFQPKAGQEAINTLIAETYKHTASVFKEVRRILERDQAVLRPVATIRDRIVQHKVQPTCPECGSASVCADAAARWNIETQAWEVSNVFDKGHGCDDCENSDIEFVWVEVR